MAASRPDQDINKWMDALGFEKSICRRRQTKVLAHERVKNAFVDPKVSVIHTGSSAEGFCGEYYSKLSRSDFDVMVSFNKLLYIVDEDKSRAMSTQISRLWPEFVMTTYIQATQNSSRLSRKNWP